MKYYIIHEQTGELICTIFERICQHPTHAYNHCHNCPLIEEYNNHCMLHSQPEQDYYEQGTQSTPINEFTEALLDEQSKPVQCILCTHEMWHYCTLKNKPIFDIEEHIICSDYSNIFI